MNLKEILEAKYPEECSKGLIRCNSKDMIEWEIGTWEVSNVLKPTKDEVLSWGKELLPLYINQQAIKNRMSEYPEPEKLAVALWKSVVENDQSELRALQEERLEIQAKYPKVPEDYE